MTGVEFLWQAHTLYPAAKRVLLIGYGDVAAGVAGLQAMALGQLDHWLNTPVGPPELQLYPAVSELLGQWARATAHAGSQPEWVRVVGPRWWARSHELRDLLGRSNIPHGFYDAEGEDGRRLLAQAGLEVTGQPAVLLSDGRVLIDPRGADSAGQAAVHLARHAKQVTLLHRGGSLAAGMSAYLVQELEQAGNITVRLHTEVTAIHGTGRLEALTLHNNDRNHRDAAGGGPVHPDRRRAPHRLAARNSPAGRPRVPADRPRPAPRRPPTLGLAACPAAAAAGDQPARSLRGRRGPPRLGQARRLGRREGTIAIQLVHQYLGEALPVGR